MPRGCVMPVTTISGALGWLISASIRPPRFMLRVVVENATTRINSGREKTII